MNRHVLTLLLAALLSQFAPTARAAGLILGRVDGFSLPDHLGNQHSLDEFNDHKLVVVAFLGTECPLAKLYAGRLQSLADEYADQDVSVLAIMSNAQDSLAEIAAFVHRHNLSYPVLKDMGNRVADKFGAKRTPQVFLLDRHRRVRYSGRIDDQFVVGIVRDKPTREDLRLAIDELLAGNSVSVPVSEPLGCIIGRIRQVNEASPVTYNGQIADILQGRCVECHREGEIGPFPLTCYEEAAGWGEMMAEVVRQQRMPPWHASPEYGSFANDRRMPEREKELLYQWVENGCPEGDHAEPLPLREFTTGWQLPRQPDDVYAMPEPFTVPADAGQEGVPYQYIRVPTNFRKDRWIEASEVQPGNRSVVHHVIVYVEPPGDSTKKRPKRRNWIFLAAYVPGLRYDAFPPKSAKCVPAGSTFVFEVHYTPVGSEQQDTTRLGIVYADDDQVEHEVITCELGNLDFEIPPGDPAHVVTATSRPIKRPLTLISMSPHMHLRGKAFRYELVLPSGDRKVLLDVPAYDFNWQTRYALAKPLELPIGSVLHCRAVYDNSPANLANPDPGVAVHWGDQSWDEMMLGYFDVVLPRDESRPPGKKPAHTGVDIVGMFDVADGDGDGGLSLEETSAHRLVRNNFQKLDLNHNGLLGLDEVLAAVQLLSAGR